MCFGGKEEGGVIERAKGLLQKDAAKEETQHRRLQPELERKKLQEARVWRVRGGAGGRADHTVTSLSICQDGYYQTGKSNTCQRACAEKGALEHCWWA